MSYSPFGFISRFYRVSSLVKIIFKKLEQDNLLSEFEISRLKCPVRSKELFNVNYPILIDFSEERSTIMKKRYYVQAFEFHSKKYFLTNDWYDKNRKLLEIWGENKLKIKSK